MITLDYALRNAPSATANLSNVDESALHYDLFLGDVRFKIDDADMSAPWGWVPVIDFAVCVDRIVHQLKPGESDAFEFTESESQITFQRQGNRILVCTTYGAPQASADSDELRTAARQFLGRMLDELMTAHPSLAQNNNIRRIYPKGIA